MKKLTSLQELNAPEIRIKARIDLAKEKGWPYDDNGFRTAEVKIKCMSLKEAKDKKISLKMRHKFLGEKNEITSFYFDSHRTNKDDYKNAIKFIKEAAKPITKVSQIAFIMPKEVGIAVCNYENSKSILLKKGIKL